MYRTTSAAALLLLSGLSPAVAQDGGVDLLFGNDGRQVFAPDGIRMHEIRFNAAETLPDGSLLLAGYRHVKDPRHPADPHFRVAVAKLAPDGRLDTTFGNDAAHPGLVIFGDINPGAEIQEARAIGVLPDGGAIIAGSTGAGPNAGFTAKIDAHGVLQSGYGNHGVALMSTLHFEDVAFDSTGRIVLAGQRLGGTPAYRAIVARLDAAGAPDAEFDGDGIVELVETSEGAVVDHAGGLRSLAIAAGDRIVVGGYQEQNAFVYGYSLARLTSTGALDPTFAGGGWLRFVPSWSDSFDASIARLTLTRHGDIVFAGDYTLTGSNHVRPVIGKLSADGVPDASFGSAAAPGFALLDVRAGYGWQRPSGLALQSDGRIVITATANEFDVPAGPSEFVAARVDTTGAPDTTFGTAGNAVIATTAPNAFADATALTLQGNRVVVVGNNGYPDASQGTQQLLVRAAVTRLSNDRIFVDGNDG